MTGFGSATQEQGTRTVSVDVRSVNHRYLKLNFKLPKALASLEAELEAVAKRHVSRGSLTFNMRFRDDGAPGTYVVDQRAALDYRDQLDKLCDSLDIPLPAESDRVLALLSLPGVVRAADDAQDSTVSPEIKQLVTRCFDEAMRELVATREAEGAALRRVLEEHGHVLERLLKAVAARAPEIPRQHRDRLMDRVQALLKELDDGSAVSESDLHRELCLLADKCDVAEELNRLQTHLDRYRTILAATGESGRELDFLLQEMLRETNTIGSKANDAEVAHAVVEMKVEVERMKEQVQNLE